MDKCLHPDVEETEAFIDNKDEELRWGEAFRQSEDLLEKLADRALSQLAAGKTQKKGFDEL